MILNSDVRDHEQNVVASGPVVLSDRTPLVCFFIDFPKISKVIIEFDDGTIAKYWRMTTEADGFPKPCAFS